MVEVIEEYKPVSLENMNQQLALRVLERLDPAEREALERYYKQ